MAGPLPRFSTLCQIFCLCGRSSRLEPRPGSGGHAQRRGASAGQPGARFPALPPGSQHFVRFSLARLDQRTHTDRPATVTRHQRAPAGRPSAGVRAEGSSGLRVRLQGSATGWRKRLLPSRVPTISVARPRRPVSPSGPPTEDRPEAASGQRWQARTRVSPANTMFLKTSPGRAAAHRGVLPNQLRPKAAPRPRFAPALHARGDRRTGHHAR